VRGVTTAHPADAMLALSPQGRRALRVVFAIAALAGLLIGLETLRVHLTTDPFADTRLYYDAATRLNLGLPLYGGGVTLEGVGPYVSPPLLAIAFRPLALLPFPVAAVIWETVIIAALVATIWRIGLRRPVLIALGCLALPILWALSVGQSELIVLLLLTVGSPVSVALAGHLKLLPWLAAAFWIGRRDRRSLLRLGSWVLAIGLAQVVLEPAATIDYLQLEWMRTAFGFRNISLFAVHPALWAGMVVVLVVLAIRLAPTRHGWAFAVALAVLASPRLLVYQLASLLAVFGGQRETATESEPGA
jgi:alpha-1,2-mannosyltransferase